jgi:hypothetical protein
MTSFDMPGSALPVGPVNDAFEQEADQVAQRVASSAAATVPAPFPAAPGGLPNWLRRKVAWPSPDGSVGSSELPRNGSQAISADVRERIEPIVGADLGAVRLHSGPEAELAADRIGARAFSYGPEIWLGHRADPTDMRLMAHEITHVVQYERGTETVDVIRRDSNPQSEATEDWSRFEKAFRDPNLIAHQKALDELGTLRSPRAFDLILSRVHDQWDTRHAMDAALVFFIFYPDVALSRLEDATSPTGGAATSVLNGLLAYRSMAHGPAVDIAYRKLDTWMAEKDAREAGALTRGLERRQIRTTVERMRQTIVNSYWIQANKLSGAATFIQEMDRFLANLPTVAEMDIADLHTKVMAAAPVVTRIEARLDELSHRVVTLIVDQHVPPDSDEIKFIEEELIKPYDDALAKGADFATIATFVGTAEAAYRDQAGRYQARKIKQLRDGWAKIAPPSTPWPVANTGDLRAGAIAIDSTYGAHKNSLQPRIESLFKRHDAGEKLPVADLAEIQRDLMTLQVEQVAYTDYVGLFLLYEELTKAEPSGLSSHVTMNFNDIRANAKQYAATIQRAVLDGNLDAYLKLAGDVDYSLIFTFAKSRAEGIRNQQLALEIGLLAFSFIAGAGLGALARGGTLLAFGAEAVEAGTIGARVVAGAEFVANVAAFTLTSEALHSATFGTKFDTASLPGKLVENAIMFGAFGAVGRLTGGIGRGAVGPLGEVLGFGARQGVNLAAFAAVGALGERVFRGQFPKDWKSFMVQSVASYAMLAVLGKAMEPFRARVGAKTLDPVIKQRQATLGARQEALQQKLLDMTGATSATGETTVTKAHLEAVRREIKDLAGDYRKLVDFLKTDGAITPTDAQQLNEALGAMEKAMTDAVLVAERARIVALDRIPDLRPTGDGVNYTYQARQRIVSQGRQSSRISGLENALQAFGEAGYEVEINAESGEILVYSPGGFRLGDLVARFTPDIGAIPDAALKPGKAPTTAEAVAQFLRDAGFQEWEIISFAGADDHALKYLHAVRVSRLLEKFTTADLKALAHALWESDTVLTDGMTTQLLKYVEAGRMEAFLQSRETAGESAASLGLDPNLEDLGMSVSGRNIRKPKTPKEPAPDPLSRIAELDAVAALEARFGPGWQPARRFYAPQAAEGEQLLSTVPEAYHPDLNVAAEVKRWILLEAGIDPAHPGGVGTPSPRTVEALERARGQSAVRRVNVPTKKNAGPLKIWMIFDIRAQGVTDVAATGASLKTLLTKYMVSYDRLMLLTQSGLVDVP